MRSGSLTPELWALDSGPRWLLTVLVSCSVSWGCHTFGPPCSLPEPQCCARGVRMVRENELVREQYRVLDDVTVTCPPLNRKRCDRLLRQRACALGADVIIFDSETLVGRRGLAQITKHARLVHFIAAPARAPVPTRQP